MDIHPTEPWLLSALYNGKVIVWDYSSGKQIRDFETGDVPIRAARFIARKQWIVAAGDDMYIRVYDYNTQERINRFEAHNDYIRCLEVHPTQPYLLSSSDDMSIKLWDWEKNWAAVRTYEGHAHYVMQVRFNPKDSNTFASASLDRSVKVWSVSSPTPNFSLEGHLRGVNTVDYYRGGDKPYLVSGSDDFTIKVWDYQTKACISTLDAHTHNVSAVLFHPRLPIIISASEDGTVRFWHADKYKIESTLNYGMERAWSLAASSSDNKVRGCLPQSLDVL